MPLQITRDDASYKHKETRRNNHEHTFRDRLFINAQNKHSLNLKCVCDTTDVEASE